MPEGKKKALHISTDYPIFFFFFALTSSCSFFSILSFALHSFFVHIYRFFFHFRSFGQHRGHIVISKAAAAA